MSESDYQNKKILIGHLYEMNDEFMSKFFDETIRKKKSEPRSFQIASNIMAGHSTKSDKTSEYPVWYSTLYLCEFKSTQSGLALVVDKLKAGRATYCRVFLNGEDRYLSEQTLKYAKEIK